MINFFTYLVNLLSFIIIITLTIFKAKDRFYIASIIIGEHNEKIITEVRIHRR